jgi:hypothetical protein
VIDWSIEKDGNNNFLCKEINKKNNTIKFHSKLDNIFDVASQNMNISRERNITTIVETLDTLYDNFVKKDNVNENAFKDADEDWINTVCSIDAKAITFNLNGDELIFLNTIPNSVNTTNEIYENYNEGNTLHYTCKYEKIFEITNENVTNRIAAWVIYDNDNVPVYYFQGTYISNETNWTQL